MVRRAEQLGELLAEDGRGAGYDVEVLGRDEQLPEREGFGCRVGDGVGRVGGGEALAGVGAEDPPDRLGGRQRVFVDK